MRERMVTRTIVSTKVIAFVANKETGETGKKVYTISGSLDEQAAEKYLRKKYETPLFKICYVISVETVEQIYGMSETDFIAHAAVMKDYFTKAE